MRCVVEGGSVDLDDSGKELSNEHSVVSAAESARQLVYEVKGGK